MSIPGQLLLLALALVLAVIVILLWAVAQSLLLRDANRRPHWNRSR